MIDLTKIYTAIGHVAEDANTPAYAVGGFVRDMLMRRETVTDLDVVVEGSGIEFARAYDRYVEEEGSLVEFGDFDTARYVYTQELPDGSKEKVFELEFAGARSEVYDSTSRKPTVVATTLEQDLKRRDFTVNAIAIPITIEGLLVGQVIDPFDGALDIEKKILRTPLDPDLTFSEDPLRMLRAARFASQLGFTLEEGVYDAIARNRERLSIVSKERVCEEFFKLLKTPVPSVGLWILYHTGLVNEFLPEVSELNGVEELYGHQHKNNLVHTFKVVDNIAERTDNVLLRFAALMHDIGKPGTKSFVSGRGWAFDMHEHLGRKIVRDVGRRLRMSRDDIEYVALLVRWHQQPIALMDDGVTDSPVRRLIVNLKDNLDDLLTLCRSDITTGNPYKLKKRLKNYDFLEKRIVEVTEKDKLRAFQSPVRGEEIMELTQLKPGPTIGKIKKALENAILDGKVENDYEKVKEYFFSIKEEYLSQAEEWEKLT
jgi:poly(A) polymerase